MILISYNVSKLTGSKITRQQLDRKEVPMIHESSQWVGTKILPDVCALSSSSSEVTKPAFLAA